MLIEIVRHTPYWVWIVLAVMLRRGYVLTRPQEVPQARVALLPAVLSMLSLGGVLSSFGARPDALLCWAAGMVLAAYETQRRGAPQGVRYLPERQSFTMPGSWTPLLLIVLVFTVKYTVGVQLALHEGLRHSGWFTIGASSGYGTLSGLFLGRALRLWHVWRRANRSGALAAFS
jgi:hypothetical protein